MVQVIRDMFRLYLVACLIFNWAVERVLHADDFVPMTQSCAHDGLLLRQIQKFASQYECCKEEAPEMDGHL